MTKKNGSFKEKEPFLALTKTKKPYFFINFIVD